MRFFKKPSVAILLTVLLVALCCVWGYSRAYADSQAAQEDTLSPPAGENNLNYFLNWVDDGADLFSMETTDTLAWDNLERNNTYGTMLAIKTLHYLNGQDIETYSKSLFESVGLGHNDFLLVIEDSSPSWYLVYGSGMSTYVEESGTLSSLLNSTLDDHFFQGGSDEGILALSDGLTAWCAQNLPEQDNNSQSVLPFLQGETKVQSISLKSILLGILFALLVNIWWIILALVVLNLLDRHRLRKYILAYPPVAGVVPPVFFRPFLFWHRHGSAWYYRMVDMITEDLYDSDEDDEPFGGAQDSGGPTYDDSQGSSQSGPYTDGEPGGPYGTGPDVGPNATFSGGAGFQGDPQQAYRQSRRGLWGLWSSACHLVYDSLNRLLRGR